MLNKGKQEGTMFKKTLLVLLSVLILSGVCFAQEEAAEEPMEEPMEEPSAVVTEEPELALAEIAICTGIEDRQPVGAGTVFSNDLEKIYCFTKIVGATDTTSVNHVWYMGDTQLASVNLLIKSASWRTWSSKTIGMSLGKGHVEIVTEGGDVLGKAEFEIQAAGEEEAAEAEEAIEEEAEEPMEEAAEETEEAEKPVEEEAQE
jgi:hypothetical protein